MPLCRTFELRAFIASKRHDFFGQDVRRKTMQRGPHLSDGTVRRILKLKGEFDQKVIP